MKIHYKENPDLSIYNETWYSELKSSLEEKLKRCWEVNTNEYK
jgi:hypothetical protein